MAEPTVESCFEDLKPSLGALINCLLSAPLLPLHRLGLMVMVTSVLFGCLLEAEAHLDPEAAGRSRSERAQRWLDLILTAVEDEKPKLQVIPGGKRDG